ncbi:hypothetical protein CHS0354_026301 [Potamilus streckersoni]|uniref:Uncharacterized protein n=1 Tax=Potamilus streckersoni TaxID=2493646 RepID=A0AAE0WAH0_9BIVA|nr:hypothetical protein CHS0354_026301 [Potamilus streckersoni]
MNGLEHLQERQKISTEQTGLESKYQTLNMNEIQTDCEKLGEEKIQRTREIGKELEGKEGPMNEIKIVYKKMQESSLKKTTLFMDHYHKKESERLDPLFELDIDGREEKEIASGYDQHENILCYYPINDE